MLFRSKVSEGFGFGFGGLGEVCGAASAMALVAGYKNSSGGVDKGITKAQTNKIVNDLLSAFKEKNTSYLCRDLLGQNGKPKLRSCDGCIEDACEILDAQLFNKK